MAGQDGLNPMAMQGQPGFRGRGMGMRGMPTRGVAMRGRGASESQLSKHPDYGLTTSASSPARS